MKIIIIGGIAAGAKVAAKARRMSPEAEISVYTQDTHVSYSACGLPFYIEGNFEDWRKLLVRSVEEFERNNIHIFLLNKVLKIIPNDKKMLYLMYLFPQLLLLLPLFPKVFPQLLQSFFQSALQPCQSVRLLSES